MKKLTIILIFLLMFSFVISGCGDKSSQTSEPAPSQTSEPAPVDQSPKPGGTLKLFVSSVSNIGFPSTMGAMSDGWVSSVALETLFRFDLQGNVVPLLAKDWKADYEAKTITIMLNKGKGIKFHDGTDFNAEAVKWNLDTYRSSQKPELKKVTSVDVVDDYTVRLNLSSFDNSIITYLTGNAGRMISPTAFENNGQEWVEQNPVGTGPFQFVSWTKDVNVKFKRFDEYWGGKPYLDGVEWVFYKDQLVAQMDILAGNLDAMAVPDPENMKEIETTGKFNTVFTNDTLQPVLMPDTKNTNSPFAKLEVRQALSYAIDQETLAESIGMGYFRPQNQLAQPGTWGYNPNVAGYPYNPEKAKELLASAGYPNGFDTTLTYFAYNKTVTDSVTALQQMLKQVGINAVQNPVTRANYIELGNKGWDGLLRVHLPSSPDPLVTLANFSAGQQYVSMYVPDEFVQKFDKAVNEVTFEGKQKAVQELMSVVDKYAIWSFLPEERTITAKSKRVQDDWYGEMPNRYINPMVWLSE
ncbi:MAG: ABC transporter substrate-binding protein [Clostridia bacterium]|nr:ABC transporter substrate-binding protein [Clostridia bacterium]